MADEKYFGGHENNMGNRDPLSYLESSLLTATVNGLYDFNTLFCNRIVGKHLNPEDEFFVYPPTSIDQNNYSPDPEPNASTKIRIEAQTIDPHHPQSVLLCFTLTCSFSLKSGTYHYTLICEGSINEPRTKSRPLEMLSFNSGPQNTCLQVLNSKAFTEFLRMLFDYRIQPILTLDPEVVRLNELIQKNFSPILRNQSVVLEN